MVTVVLDTNLTPELIEEGLVRELVSKIQTMRKEAGFEVMDKITVSAMGNDKIDAILKKYESEIRDESTCREGRVRHRVWIQQRVEHQRRNRDTWRGEAVTPRP